MSALRWVSHPELRRPALVAAFEGWNDAAGAASNALRWLADRLDAYEIASLDPEAYFDFQANRPRVVIRDGATRSITWPETRFLAARVESADRDLVLLLGVEPNLRWSDFCADVIAAARAVGADVAVSLGALLADVPHTRAIPLTGVAADPATVAALGLQRSRYEGPTGIVGVLHDACRHASLESVSLWAPVPHYVAAAPNPMATHTLLAGLDAVLDLHLDLRNVEAAVGAWRAQVDEVVAGDEEISAYVRRLERQIDEAEADDDDEDPSGIAVLDDGGDEAAPFAEWDEDDLPTGDDLAEDLERFLRGQDDDPDDPDDESRA